MMRKSDNYVGEVPNDSTVYAANDAGNLNSHAGKDANVSNCDLKNLDLSQVDDDDTLNKKLPSAVDVILSSKSAVTKQENLVSHTGNNSTPRIRYQEKKAATSVDVILSSKSADTNQGNLVSHTGNNSTPRFQYREKKAATSKLLIPGDKARTFCGPQNDICSAVNEAHAVQLAAEAIEMGKGYPVAEFEKLLHSASPVICPSANIDTCQVCIHGQGAPLCRHEIPNISLGNLWQWYEKHGNYGLQIKAEEHTSSQQHRLKFSAYFVPFLSSVQLFKYHRTCTSDKDNGTPSSIDVADSGINKISESSPIVGLRTAFPLRVPQPRVENSSSLQKRNVVSDSRASSDCGDTDLTHPPVESKLPDDSVELLFEYFERDQPQSRKPLLEKIQEIVAGNGPSSYGVFGDPSILQSALLPDLHPHSWFSVAWYPIYRIPEGNFRAAFLTYHSLGHYVHRGPKLYAPRLAAGIVSPVVGLRTYNAQSECWFQPRHSMEHLKEVALDNSDPASVLQDRLKTLEQTATLMSRAVRVIGAETLVNKHNDYEFFQSRRRRFLP